MSGQPHKITLNGQVMYQLRCRKCHRDFARLASEDKGGWRAVNPLPTRFDFFDDATSARWLAQRCPGIVLVADEDDRRRTART